MKIWHIIWTSCILALGVKGGAVGTAWDVSPSQTAQSSERASWPRLESPESGSAFEVRSVSGVGHLAGTGKAQGVEHQSRNRREIEDFEVGPIEYIEYPAFEDFLRNRRGLEDVEELEANDAWLDIERIKRSVEDPTMHHFTLPHIDHLRKPRVRRDAEPKMEKISGTKNVREARLNSPETWSKQPISVEFRRQSNSDQSLFEKDLQGSRNHHAPKADFVTGHRRDFSESRESRDLPAHARAYPDYVPMFQEKVKERDFDVRIPRRYYPDRFENEREYDGRRPAGSLNYYNRYNEEEGNPYGRAYTPMKPKRIIYYAHLPEVARKPVDLRSYRYPYDDVVRSPAVAVSSSTTYNRAPGNVDPNTHRYRSPQPYERDAYRPYRRDPYRRPYGSSYQPRADEEQYTDRAALREDPRIPELGGDTIDKKIYSRISDRAESRLPWPVQVGTEVNVKDDERIPGRKIFGQNTDYNRYQVNSKLHDHSNVENSNDDRKSN